jgi:hypothetical protein
MTYKIRLGGTNEFVSGLDPYASHCCPPGEVKFVEGWNNPAAIVFLSKTSAERAKDMVAEIEGFHTSIEEFQFLNSSIEEVI